MRTKETKKEKELSWQFFNFCKEKKLAIDETRFDAMATLKPFTVTLVTADDRLGKMYAIALNLPGGTITILKGYSKASDLFNWMAGAMQMASFENTLQQYKNNYKERQTA